MEKIEKTYLQHYLFDWEAFDVLLGGRSVLDGNFYSKTFFSREAIESFLEGYGYNLNNPIQRAELFGHYQEAIEFIRRYFLKEGNSEGLDYKVPARLQQVTGIVDLFQLVASTEKKVELLWGSIILKVMHIVLHADKDLRYQYFPIIQKQIFDRFYRFMDRDKENNLYLMNGADPEDKIQIVDFQTKAKKTRDSIIIKLLHKKESVAEELFDRIGIRFITKNKFDVLRVIRFLMKHNVFIVHNIKPSRSQNSIVDLDEFKKKYYEKIKEALKGGWKEDYFYEQVNDIAESCGLDHNQVQTNDHSSKKYQAVHFTGRQLVHYKNPLVSQLSEIKKIAKKKKISSGTDELLDKISQLNMSHISRDVRFFYPFEVQITDIKSHEMNSKGEASHKKYKKSQMTSAMNRLFKPLIDYYEKEA